MGLTSQKVQAHVITEDVKYAPSKKCVVCGLPTRMAALKCLHCIEAAYLAEERAYTRQWLLEHPALEVEVGHDKHGLLHLSFLRERLRNVGWCGERVTQKRDKRKLVARHAFPATVPEKICVPCLAAWDEMGLGS
ncbi:MAG TPA: hypothetical protein VNW90_25250 [Acetobacteraceae bacterium]|jgi:hypothetical protein|nr:hypothetical protein [Acetobacteraceae bacterium]